MFVVFKGRGQSNPQEEVIDRRAGELGGEPQNLGAWLILGPPLEASL